jgi:hypothetical protein
MRTEQLVGIGLFTMALVLTIYTWRDTIASRTKQRLEGFESSVDIMDKSTIDMISKANKRTPSDSEAVAAHQTLLRYIRDDFSKGVKFARDFGDRFFGPDLQFRKDLDVRTLMDNYQSPLQRL